MYASIGYATGVACQCRSIAPFAESRPLSEPRLGKEHAAGGSQDAEERAGRKNPQPWRRQYINHSRSHHTWGWARTQILPNLPPLWMSGRPACLTRLPLRRSGGRWERDGLRANVGLGPFDLWILRANGVGGVGVHGSAGTTGANGGRSPILTFPLRGKGFRGGGRARRWRSLCGCGRLLGGLLGL